MVDFQLWAGLAVLVNQFRVGFYILSEHEVLELLFVRRSRARSDVPSDLACF